MGKIVIPKHDALEMEIVLKIHYEDNDWIKESDFKRRLQTLIGSEQYSSSYPKKAQIPAYFGFLESKLTPGGRVSERRITESGREMYRAIVSNDDETKQRLVMEALENMIFGRNNAGVTSSDSDIEPPALLVKCILDTGYCTSKEYAFLIWSLNDLGKKYYESLRTIIAHRSAGGVEINAEAEKYKDWKPILAMIRWGFLIKSDDDAQKVLLSSKVIDKYSDRLQKLKVYNIDKIKGDEDVDFDEITISMDYGKSYKPFRIDDSNASKVKEGHFYQNCGDVEKQNIFKGDYVLFVNRSLTRLEAYYSYLIKELVKTGDNYEVDVQRQFAINKSKEQELLSAFKDQDKQLHDARAKKTVASLFQYKDIKTNLEIKDHPDNRDVLPAYLTLRALLELKHISDRELDYLVFSIVDGGEAYTDIIRDISNSRRGFRQLDLEGTENYSKQPAILLFKERGIFVPYMRNGEQGIQLNADLSDHYTDLLKRLTFYAVDIEKLGAKHNDTEDDLPQVIKAIKAPSIANNVNGTLFVEKKNVLDNLLVQGDFVVFVDSSEKRIVEMYVYQIDRCKATSNGFDISYDRRYVINPNKQNEILEMLHREG
jgi:hypothetical protein